MYLIKCVLVVILNDKNPKIGVYINFNKLLLYRYFINAKNPKKGLMQWINLITLYSLAKQVKSFSVSLSKFQIPICIFLFI